MATASPTPMGTGSQYAMGRRTSARQALRRPPSRSQLGRAELNVSAGNVDSQVSQSQHFSNLNDSSDDEIPVPMKLSALTKALLDDGGASAAPRAAVVLSSSGPAASATRKRVVLGRSTSAALEDRGNGDEVRRHVRASSAQLTSSPTRGAGDSSVPRKRVVRLSTTNATPGGSSLQTRLRSSASTQRKRPASRDRSVERNGANGLESSSNPEPPADPGPGVNINTPSNGPRRVNIITGSSGTRGATGSGSAGASSKNIDTGTHSDHEDPEEPQTGVRSRSSLTQGSASHYGTSNGRKVDDSAAPQSSLRIRRIGKVPGSFLSGPARRGRRRQSEEENSPAGEDGEGIEGNLGSVQEPGDLAPSQADAAPPSSSFYSASYRELAVASGSPVSTKDPVRAALRTKPSLAVVESGREKDIKRPAALEQGDGPPPYSVPSTTDQENAAAAIPARSRGVVVPNPIQDKLLPKDALHASPAMSPAERKALGQISRNTPHRPAPPPPPPKMSVLDAVTSTAGAATTAQASKKQRVLLKVNGRAYHRLDCIGRGGSAKVYRVTAENGKMFALKRVSLENADTSAVKGFLGEIELLRRLSGVDRVIQMYDSELNQEKQMLSVLMEMGELDLGDLIKSRHIQEAYRLDPVFVRFCWKEMLECLQAVHSCDIVHSDLKPANFVMVKGRLKLIDFGIAGAIQTDETVNVHRENQIGTPNYMSPESLMDSQHYASTAANNGRPDRSHGRAKLMKIGKPSDVWSLGCILYQLVYGAPPFGHIPNQLARCQAIIAWDHRITFPEKGAGGVLVPPSLIDTMKKCLIRDQQFRPTCEQLLADQDPFLYPQEVDMERIVPVTEELLARVIHSVVARCRERMPTDGELMSAWPAAYWSSVKKSLAAKDPRP
ncbi:TTK protein kinase [Magnaporthiopsis poae ATCC 64411]|uniref:TTK protein kinase n=1 Tax=Magnaporthiopsis poae (strain ATCC 64411 / 73-15) TaxID=644358 RepID=A0A0C4DRL9_MAGP6|nr:TTK protein kinase [Magnaporthiopsis poae ATCC 64411]